MANAPAAATEPDVARTCEDLATRALDASRSLNDAETGSRTVALERVADRLIEAADEIIAANATDLATGRDLGLSAAMLDRLTLDGPRIEKMAASVRQIAAQVDPVGQVIEGYVRPNGLRIEKVRVPIGVVLIIYESRPNVTSDAAALCIKSGNSVILRGGKESFASNTRIARAVADGIAEASLPRDCVQLVPTTDRAAVGHLLKMVDRIDVAIPRGGESLIRAVVEQAHIPVIKHYTGNCHVYVDAHADDEMAREICVNAKTQRPGVCNAAETILIHREAAERGLLARICADLAAAGCEIRGDASTRSAFSGAAAATEEDWSAEYLDLRIAVGVVDDLDAAVAHINRYGSRHTDAIVTRRIEAADAFVQRVDSANVFVNCSTRFSDGGEYGLGAEIGISTDKLHARGPMGAADLTTYKWVARGDGQVRT
ncbi:MAG: glutamate-5-semialdehyde dehydrogenase [Phycisphaeraceae bacterium]|nr:glutamate-5-semialdehyde dehydrogenase [Phycisphaeraceae bacterium]